MKFLGRRGDHLEFELAARERDALEFVLRRYPALDPGYHQITRPEGPGLEEEQRLLIESMAENQSHNRRRVEEFLARNLKSNPGAAGQSSAVRLHLSLAETDWLLEILNDVRLGAWVSLGRPSPGRLPRLKSAARSLADYSAMEIAGYVQTVVLHALQD
jgi:hypothetical protein